MELQEFNEINSGIFKHHSKPLTLFNVCAAVVAIVGGVYGYWHGISNFIHAATQWLPVDGKTQASIEAQINAHVATPLRLLAPIALVVLVYLLVFAYQAGFLATKNRKLLVLAQQKAIQDLEQVRKEAAEDKHRILGATDAVERLAESVGVAPWNVRYVYEILNYDGDCKLFQDEEFKVTGLKLYHMRRQHSSTCAKKRSEPIIEVRGGVPSGTTPDKSYDDVGNERIFNFRFAPALENTQNPISIHISEQVDKNFIMNAQEFPQQWPFDTGLEYVKYGVSQPTQELEMKVVFPIGYTVQEKMLFRVRYGNSETDHQQEQDRIRQAKGLTQAKDDQGRNYIQLKVEKPVVGLTYAICWHPPDLKTFNALRSKYVVTQTGRTSETAANAVTNPHVQPS